MGCATLQEARSRGEIGQRGAAGAPGAGARRIGAAAAAAARTSHPLGSWGRGEGGGGEDQAGIRHSASPG